MRCVACKRLNNNEEGISFHRFPKNARRKISWMTLLGIEEPISARAQICSDHFQEKDFVTRLSGKKCLRQNAFPKIAFPIAFGKELEVSPRYFTSNGKIKNTSKSSPHMPTIENESSSTWSAPEVENEKSPKPENVPRYFVLKTDVVPKVSEPQPLPVTNSIEPSSDTSTTLSSSEETLTASEVDDEIPQECPNLPRNVPFPNDDNERAQGSQPLTSPVENESSTTLSASEDEHEISNEQTGSPQRYISMKRKRNCSEKRFSRSIREKYLQACKLKQGKITSSSILSPQKLVCYDFNGLIRPDQQVKSTAVPSSSSMRDSSTHHTKPACSALPSQIISTNKIETDPLDDSISSPLEMQSSDIIKTETFNNSIILPLETESSENCDVKLERAAVITSKVRYVGALTVEHFSTPAQAKRNLALMCSTIEKQRKKIKMLNQQKRRMAKKMNSFRSLVQRLDKDNLLSGEASRALMHIIKLKNTSAHCDPPDKS